MANSVSQLSVATGSLFPGRGASVCVCCMQTLGHVSFGHKLYWPAGQPLTWAGMSSGQQVCSKNEYNVPKGSESNGLKLLDLLLPIEQLSNKEWYACIPNVQVEESRNSSRMYCPVLATLFQIPLVSCYVNCNEVIPSLILKIYSLVISFEWPTVVWRTLAQTSIDGRRMFFNYDQWNYSLNIYKLD